jgi:glycosyltransferase involved in cell wall biosynthesis
MDLLLFQTKAMVLFFRNNCRTAVEWYSNSRPMYDNQTTSTESHDVLGLVYVGHVKPNKGVLDLVTAVKQLPDDSQITVTFYGPLQDGVKASDLTTNKSRYCGLIPNDQVNTTLATFDALVLPTKYQGEGYPGVIIEAFGAGLPVISTKWQAIPEIVNDNNGILVEPGDSCALAAAMKRLADSPDELRRLSRGARESKHDFDADAWADVFVDHVKRLVTK